MVRGSAEDGVEAMVAYRRRITVGAGLLALPLPGTAAPDQFAARRAAKDAVHKSHRVELATATSVMSMTTVASNWRRCLWRFDLGKGEFDTVRGHCFSLCLHCIDCCLADSRDPTKPNAKRRGQVRHRSFFGPRGMTRRVRGKRSATSVVTDGRRVIDGIGCRSDERASRAGRRLPRNADL